MTTPPKPADEPSDEECTVPLTRGQVAIVDARDFAAVSEYKWHAYWSRDSTTFYAVTTIREAGKKPRELRMHRLIASPFPEQRVDHIDHDGLNNRRANLRICTDAQNACNTRKRANCSSKYKGVHWHAVTGKWAASISGGVKQPRGNRRKMHLGLYDTEEAAARAYDAAALKLFGDFALVNFGESGLSKDDKIASLERQLESVLNANALAEQVARERDGDIERAVTHWERVCALIEKERDDALDELARLRAESMRGAVELLMGRVRQLNTWAREEHGRGDHIRGSLTEAKANDLERTAAWLEQQSATPQPDRGEAHNSSDSPGARKTVR